MSRADGERRPAVFTASSLFSLSRRMWKTIPTVPGSFSLSVLQRPRMGQSQEFPLLPTLSTGWSGCILLCTNWPVDGSTTTGVRPLPQATRQLCQPEAARTHHCSHSICRRWSNRVVVGVCSCGVDPAVSVAETTETGVSGIWHRPSHRQQTASITLLSLAAPLTW